MGQKSVVLDTETTGLDPKSGHRLTEIGCIELVARQPTGRRFQTYLNPERELDERAAAITGLSYDFLKDKPKFQEKAEDFLAFIEGAELIIHNAKFDLGFLNHELRLWGHEHLPLEAHYSVIDTLTLAKKIHPGHRYYNLDALCQRYKVENTHRELHGALLDAEILTEVYLKMTSGQTSLGFGGEEEETSSVTQTMTQNSNAMRGQSSVSAPVQTRPPFKIVHASEHDRALHRARLEAIRNEV